MQSMDTKIAHRDLSQFPKLVVKASDKYLILADNRKIFDACGGAAVTSIGHCNPEVLQDIQKQLTTVSYVHSLEFTTNSTEEFGREFLKDYDNFGRCYVVNSGSEANNAALKLSIQYFKERGFKGKNQIISRNQSYHGNCIAGLSISGHPARRHDFEDILIKTHKVSPAYEYRYKEDSDTTEDYVNSLVNELENKILDIGPENVAAFFAETIVGATTGCVTAPPEYFKKIRKVCDKYDILLVLDEIMCGSGRTGTFFAWEEEGIEPDIFTCGKALSSGYSPLSVCVFSNKVVGVLKNGSGLFHSGHTFQAYPLACAIGVSVLKYIKNNDLLYNVRARGAELGDKLKARLDFKIVGNIRGKGLFWGIELVKDKHTKESFDPNLKIGYVLKDIAFEEGIAIYPGSGTVDGINGDHVLIAPMYIVTVEDIDYIVDVLYRSVRKLQKKLEY